MPYAYCSGFFNTLFFLIYAYNGFYYYSRTYRFG